MKKLPILVFLIPILLSVNACSNAIAFHQSERNSIALEVRTTDPQQPVQGVIGIKNRTIVVAPGLNDVSLAGFTSSGDATSVVSDFYFNREPGTNSFGKTTVRSAFITGAAAASSPNSSIEALSGIGAGPLDDIGTVRLQTLGTIVNQLQLMDSGGDATATGHLAAIDVLADEMPNDLDSRTYYDLTGGDLIEIVTFPRRAGFEGALDYLNMIRGSLSALEDMEQDRAITLNGAAIDSSTLQQLQQSKVRIEAERNKFFEDIGNDPAIDMAAAYVISKI